MALKFIHTADWQLGKPFSSVPGDAAALLRDARFEAVRSVAALAAEHRVDAVLVAGDAFDANDVTDATMHRALHAMGGFTGAWIMLPGNHDAHLAECVWTRLARLGLPPNITVVSEPQIVELAHGAAMILAAPLTTRQTFDDLTAWMDTAQTSAGAIRVGLAHGSVRERLPMAADAGNPIAADRADRARLDYLALGDWHGLLEVAPRTWYAGTPEPDRFRANDPGHVLLVELDEPGAVPRVRSLATARHSWITVRVRLSGEPDAADIVDRALADLGEPARMLVWLTMEGGVGLVARTGIDAVLERWSARLCQLRVDDAGLAIAADAADLARYDDGGVVGHVANRLAARLTTGSPDERAEAELALRHLWSVLGRLPAA